MNVPAKSTRKSTVPARKAPASNVSLIIASAPAVAKQAETVVSTLVNLNFAETEFERGIDATVEAQERFRRMFPAKPGGASDILGSDQPDLIGQSEAYRAAWGKVMNAARESLAERYVSAYGFPTEAAATLAKQKVETDRKSVSVKLRNRLEGQVRAEIENPVERARFMLAHGFKFSTTVTGDSPCIGGKDWTLKDGVLTVPGHKVDAVKGTVTALKSATSPAAQTGNGKDDKTPATAVAAVSANLLSALVAHDPLKLLVEAESIIGTAAGMNPVRTVGEGETATVDTALVARHLASLEAKLVALTSAWGITREQLVAARKANTSAPVPTAKRPSEEERAEAFARKLEAETASK